MDSDVHTLNGILSATSATSATSVTSIMSFGINQDMQSLTMVRELFLHRSNNCLLRAAPSFPSTRRGERRFGPLSRRGGSACRPSDRRPLSPTFGWLFHRFIPNPTMKGHAIGGRRCTGRQVRCRGPSSGTSI
ncbi:hypothetical protein EV356DRAFT_261069 [Viridothelium virens]|uniref:Uncharacterized protein n=1 Tax=Viridothelium virens TaxID=1048519 RepID=A0A6A6H246_VIRVR|nr:hypothetical protein EV356DRAFT_261069 [Viridothelium virens]